MLYSPHPICGKTFFDLKEEENLQEVQAIEEFDPKKIVAEVMASLPTSPSQAPTPSSSKLNKEAPKIQSKELNIVQLSDKEEKENIQSFISQLPVAFKDQIEFDEPQSLEEAIRNLNHCYEKSKRKPKFKHDWKGNENTKGKFPKK